MTDLFKKHRASLEARRNQMDTVSDEIREFENGLVEYHVNFSTYQELPSDAFKDIKECEGFESTARLIWCEGPSKWRLVLEIESEHYGNERKPLIETKVETRIYCHQFLQTFLDKIMKEFDK